MIETIQFSPLNASLLSRNIYKVTRKSITCRSMLLVPITYNASRRKPNILHGLAYRTGQKFLGVFIVNKPPLSCPATAFFFLLFILYCFHLKHNLELPAYQLPMRSSDRMKEFKLRVLSVSATRTVTCLNALCISSVCFWYRSTRNRFGWIRTWTSTAEIPNTSQRVHDSILFSVRRTAYLFSSELCFQLFSLSLTRKTEIGYY